MRYLLILGAFIYLAFSCRSNYSTENEFYSENSDTLILSADKYRDGKLISTGFGHIGMYNREDYNRHNLVYPNTVEDIQVNAFKIDFSQPDSIMNNNLSFITGRIADSVITIFDLNQNMDLTDDPIFPLIVFKPGAENINLIPVKYTYVDDGQIFSDSTWYNIGLYQGDILADIHQYFKAHFTLDELVYELELVNETGSPLVTDPKISLTMENGIKKDSIRESQILELGEYLKLNKIYYQFSDVSRDGRKIVLIRESHFNKKIGTQVGMLAPAFEAITTTGDTINFNRDNKEFILIANVSQCGPSSFSVFNSLVSRVDPELLKIIGLSHGFTEILNGIQVDIAQGFNEDLYKSYRDANSSYNTMLIDTTGRIIDKFNIHVGMEHLADFIKE
jgi:hypothetical protein